VVGVVVAEATWETGKIQTPNPEARRLSCGLLPSNRHWSRLAMVARQVQQLLVAQVMVGA
jgi:hypothetical protein